MKGDTVSKTLKVAICIPCYGDPKAKFMQSLLNMVNYFSVCINSVKLCIIWRRVK